MTRNNDITRIPLHFFSFKRMNKIGKRFAGLGNVLLKLRPKTKEELKKIGSRVNPIHYASCSFLSALIYGIIFSLFAYFILSIGEEVEVIESMEVTSVLLGFLFFILAFLLHLIYPKLILGKIASKENKDLLFALREITTQINGGVPLFDAMKNVAESDYGYISKDFEGVVRDIESGTSESDALKKLVIKTESRFLKKAVWQMINALESGASMEVALPGIIKTLEEHLVREIKDYSSNMNFLMLVYMLGAAAVPSLGITFLVLLSVFSGLGVTMETILLLVMGSAAIQLAIIGYMSTTRPPVFEG